MSTAPIFNTPDPRTPQAEAIARKFVGMGAHVIFFPRGNKRCTTLNWESKATNDLEAALRWARQDPYANVGIVGKQDGAWALDDDAGLVLEYEKIHGSLQTYITNTVSGGRHFIFKQNARSWAMGNTSIKDEKKRELLSARIDDRYVVSAGSWAYPHNDETQPLTQYTAIDPLATIVEAPDSLLDFIQAKNTEWKAKANKPAPGESTTRQVHEGGRNNYLTSWGGKLRHAGAEYDQILPVLIRRNENECVPPLPEAEVQTVARSVSRYQVGVDTSIQLTQQPAQTPAPDFSNWRDMFRSVGELEQGAIDVIINGVLQEGVCFIGASPSDGKTLMGLSWAKAISTGTPLFGLPQYSVDKPRPVIYLIPESGDRAFRVRCEDFRLPDDKSKFMCRTISSGASLSLTDPHLLEAVRVLHPVIFLDTAIRFMRGRDENSSAENKMLVDDVISLRAAGAVAVVLAHHATKASQNEVMTMENMLRGSSDLAAMCDQIYGIRKDRVLYAHGAGAMEIDLVNLKDREQIGDLTNLRLAASRIAPAGSLSPTVSIIHETGNFRVVDERAVAERGIQHLLALIKRDPNMPVKELARQTDMSEYTVEQKLKEKGWHRTRGVTSLIC